MDGILLVDKPSGWTSFDIVARVRGILRQSGEIKPKIGHTGTLDPLATGLLILVLGNYTKRAQEFSRLDKTYEVRMKLGETSLTGDDEGEKTKINTHKPSEPKVKQALEQFIGEIEQVPPVYSAIKVDGQRAYKMARAGKTVTIQPRKVKIYDVTDVVYTYPEVRFTVKVSSGTYVRTLVEDIGKKLGTGAYMSGLRRTSVGQFSIDKAQPIKDLSSEVIYKCIQTLL